MEHNSNQRHKGTLSFRRGNIFNLPEFLRHFEEKRIGEFWRAMVLFQKLAHKYRQVFPEFCKSCPDLPPIFTPIALTQELWQNTSYLQVSGLNNWFYVVITIFAQHLSICRIQSKIDGMTAPFGPTWRRVRQQLLMAVWF